MTEQQSPLPETEIEVKVFGFSEASLASRLTALGARFDKEEHQTNYHIASSVHPLPGSDYLRIRETRVDGREQPAELTYKKRLSEDGARVNEEITVHVDDVSRTLQLLSLLGYDRVSMGKKKRRRYLLSGARIEFDTWDAQTLATPYMEIEAKSKAHLQSILALLEIPQKAVSTLSIAQLQELERRGVDFLTPDFYNRAK